MGILLYSACLLSKIGTFAYHNSIIWVFLKELLFYFTMYSLYVHGTPTAFKWKLLPYADSHINMALWLDHFEEVIALFDFNSSSKYVWKMRHLFLWGLGLKPPGHKPLDKRQPNKSCPRTKDPWQKAPNNEWVSEWLLFNANSAIVQLCHGKNKLIFNEMMMTSALF